MPPPRFVKLPPEVGLAACVCGSETYKVCAHKITGQVVALVCPVCHGGVFLEDGRIPEARSTAKPPAKPPPHPTRQ